MVSFLTRKLLRIPAEFAIVRVDIPGRRRISPIFLSTWSRNVDFPRSRPGPCMKNEPSALLVSRLVQQ